VIITTSYQEPEEFYFTRIKHKEEDELSGTVINDVASRPVESIEDY